MKYLNRLTTTFLSVGMAAMMGAAHADEVTVSYFDVGQADATLFQAEGCDLLIDGGRHDQDDVLTHLRQAGVEQLNLMIGTHSHADHIGQFSDVLAAIPVGQVWLSGWEHTTRTFERTLDAILESDADYHEPRSGEAYSCGPLTVEVLNPVEPLQDVHDGIVVRIVHDEVSFLFTGDAEVNHETQMLSRGENVQASVLQLGHHGSYTSTMVPFIRAVKPDLAIYSAEADSRYGHPHDEVVQRLSRFDVPLIGTAEHGTITLVSNGRDFDVKTQRKGESSKSAAGNGCVDLNRAGRNQLVKISHIGDSRADQVKQLRAEQPFSSVQNITRVHGIGQGRMRDIVNQGLACVE